MKSIRRYKTVRDLIRIWVYLKPGAYDMELLREAWADSVSAAKSIGAVFLRPLVWLTLPISLPFLLFLLSRARATAYEYRTAAQRDMVRHLAPVSQIQERRTEGQGE